jgi:UDP-GlcNAc3NAcA epimerase
MMVVAVEGIVTVVGARPQFIKAAPVSQALQRIGVRETLIHTGQHFDALMSDVFFAELGVPEPARNLEISSCSHGAMTGRMLEKLEAVLIEMRPRTVLIYGDTNSTLAGALAAAKLHIPVAHVEAGLRSFNRCMPEEINRMVADQLSSLLFCPTAEAVKNLAAEGIKRGVHYTGDVMYDATLAAIGRAKQVSGILSALALERRTYAVATIHRAENTDNADRFASVVAWLETAAQDMPVIWPVHPRTRRIFEKCGISQRCGLRLIEPLGYLDMTWLVNNASAVYTDSGGLQKEAYFHRVPCVTLRDETEWVETIDAGWNRLWSVSHYVPRKEILDYGTGEAALQIAALIRKALTGP